MTQREIEKALPFWKSVLRLEDWDISVRTGRAFELVLDGEDNEGLNYIHPEEMVSEIVLRRGATEETLVHEMLHLVLDGDKELGPYDILHERAINKISASLIMLKNDNRNIPGR